MPITATFQRPKNLSAAFQRPQNLAATFTEVLTTLVRVPVADFKANPLVIGRKEKIQFVDLSANKPDSWSWKLDDVEFSTDQNPLYQIPVGTTLGNHTIKLTATNVAGSGSEEKADYIEVVAQRPLLTKRTGLWPISCFDCWNNGLTEAPTLFVMNTSAVNDYAVKLEFYTMGGVLISTRWYKILAQNTTEIPFAVFIDGGYDQFQVTITLWNYGEDVCYTDKPEGADVEVDLQSFTLSPISGYMLHLHGALDFRNGIPDVNAGDDTVRVNVYAYRDSVNDGTTWYFLQNITHLTGQPSGSRMITVNWQALTLDGTEINSGNFVLLQEKCKFFDVATEISGLGNPPYFRMKFWYDGAVREVTGIQRLMAVGYEVEEVDHAAQGAKYLDWEIAE